MERGPERGGLDQALARLLVAEERKQLVGRHAGQHVLRADLSLRAADVDGDDATSLERQPLNAQLGPMLTTERAQALEEHRAQSVSPSVDAVATRAPQRRGASAGNEAGLGQIRGEASGQRDEPTHQLRRIVVVDASECRAEDVLVVGRQTRGHALAVAAIPEPVGREHHVLGKDRLDGCADLRGSLRDPLVRQERRRRLALDRVQHIVVDVEAMIAEQQLEAGTIGLDAATEQLHEVELGDEALHPGRFRAGERHRCRRQHVRPEAVPIDWLVVLP